MNSKRLLLGFFLVALSFFLVYPKTGLPFLNWGQETLNLILALIPVLLIGKGLFELKGVADINISSFGGCKEVGIEDAETRTSFEAKNNWRSKGSDIWQAKVEDGAIKPEEGKETCHYGKKVPLLSS